MHPWFWFVEEQCCHGTYSWLQSYHRWQVSCNRPLVQDLVCTLSTFTISHPSSTTSCFYYLSHIVLVDLNEFSSIFRKVQHSHPDIKKTLKPPQNQFKKQIKFHQCTATRGSYVHKPIVNFFFWGGGGILKCYFYAIFSKYWWFQTKQFTRLLEFIKLYETKPIRELFLFSLFTKTLIWL